MAEVGDREYQEGMLPLELTEAGTWTSVCPVDDVALTARDDQGRSSCPVCGRHHNELSDLARRM